MSNTNLTVDEITAEALRVAHQMSNFIGTVNRQYDGSFAKSGAKIGNTLRIRLPNKFKTVFSAVMDVQDVTQQAETLTVGTQAHVPMSFTAEELTMDIDRFSQLFIRPAMQNLISNVESAIMGVLYKAVYNEWADVGDSVTLADVLQVRKILGDNLTPLEGRTLSLDTQASVDLVSANSTLFNDQSKIAQQYRDGYLKGRFLGFEEIFENTHWPIHTTGTDDGTGDYLINQTSWTQGAAALTVDTGAGTFKAGDIIDIAAAASPVIGPVYRVHSETKATSAVRQQFVVPSDVDASATSIPISPAIYTTGPLQNVSNVPDNNGLVFKREYNGGTAIGNAADYQVCMGYHKDFAVVAFADLILPKGVDFAARQVVEDISLRVVRDYNINNDQMPCRIDVFYGQKAVRPEWACRLGHH